MEFRLRVDADARNDFLLSTIGAFIRSASLGSFFLSVSPERFSCTDAFFLKFIGLVPSLNEFISLSVPKLSESFSFEVVFGNLSVCYVCGGFFMKSSSRKRDGYY